MSLLEITVDIDGKQIPIQTADDLQWLLRIMDIIEPDANTRSKALKASWTEKRKVEQSERMRETWRQRREAERP